MSLWINLGRLHPLLVHLPIGIIFFAALLFAFKQWKQSNRYDEVIFLALICASASAGFSLLTGLNLSNEGGYDADLIFWHKWMGISMTLLLFALTAIFKWSRKSNVLINILLILIIGLLTLTGHYGGGMTHGTNYLFESPQTEKNIISGADPSELNVYADLIQPIFDQKCVSCHRPGKKKGDLLLIDHSSFLVGGKNGKIFNAEKPLESELLRRLSLPISHEEHMPPEGKLPITTEESELINWWILNKACADCLVGDLERTPQIDNIFARITTTNTTLDTSHLKPLKDQQIAQLTNSAFLLSPRSKQSNLISLRVKETVIEKKAIRLLQEFKDYIQELNFSHAQNMASLAPTIFDIKNLQKLQLQHSDIVDGDLESIGQLKNLLSLNLYSTAITNTAIPYLSQLAALEDLFIWQSQIDEAGIAQLKKNLPRVRIHAGVDQSIFGNVSLNPPLIVADTDLFQDSMLVVLKSNLNDSKVYYTLDGSDPESTSKEYRLPILLKQSQEIKAIATKSGWGQSAVANRQFVQYRPNVLKVQLSANPDDKYSGQGAQTLIDGIRSSIDFKSQRWLGYQGAHVEVILNLAQEAPVSQIFVSALHDAGSWIFYPTGLEVFKSYDGKTYEKIESIEIPDLEIATPEKKYFSLSFDPISTPYLKLKVKSMLENPSWHPNPGGKSWLFLDEIVVE